MENCIDFDDSYLVGYLSGQRVCRLSARLKPLDLDLVGLRRYLFFSDTSGMNRADFQKGFADGYTDEREGTAHPLPALDLPYRIDEMSY